MPRRDFANKDHSTAKTHDLETVSTCRAERQRFLCFKPASLASSPEAVEVGHDVLAFAVVDDPSLRHEADVVEQLVRLGRCD